MIGNYILLLRNNDVNNMIGNNDNNIHKFSGETNV